MFIRPFLVQRLPYSYKETTSSHSSNHCKCLLDCFLLIMYVFFTALLPGLTGTNDRRPKIPSKWWALTPLWGRHPAALIRIFPQ